MRSSCYKNARPWLPCFCLWLALISAATAKDIIIPLDERLLVHLETTADHLAARERADPALQKDFAACQNDKKIDGDTPAAISTVMAARHPRMTGALAVEGWKPGDFYLVFATLASLPFTSELSHGGVPDSDKGVRRNVAFYDGHKARILAVITKLGRLMGMVME